MCYLLTYLILFVFTDIQGRNKGPPFCPICILLCSLAPNSNVVFPILFLLSSFKFFRVVHVFVFPTGVHRSAVLSSFFLKTWPIHLHLLVASLLFIASCPVVLNSCLFEIVCGHTILIMFQRHFVWNVCKQVERRSFGIQCVY